MSHPASRPAPPRVGGLTLLFAVKAFVAAMLAYYIALRIGLTRPYWAVITAYIVAQPLAGAVLSKALFRMIGTVVGAVVAILLVPNLVNAPELLTLALALWLGLCTYVSLLDRTPRAYVALLAGYTAGIIGFSSVGAPADIFTLASLRVQEIVIGIIAATLIHGGVFPQSVVSRLRQRAAAILGDAECWSRDALAPAARTATLDADRRRLAVDLHELNQLAVHLPYDTAGIVPRIGVLRALQEQLALLLPLASAVEDRIEQLAGLGAAHAGLTTLVADVRDWLAMSSASQDSVANDLVARARALEPVVVGPVRWRDALLLSALDRLAALIRAHAAARALHALLGDRHAALSEATAQALADARRRPLHRDHGMAFRGAVATTLTVLVGCSFWIGTAWADGGSAVVIASIICALFSNLDDPAPVVWRVLYGALAAAVLAMLYAFAILPQATDFVPLVLVVAPVLLAIGVVMVDPRWSPAGIGFVLIFPGVVGFDDRYDSAFATVANTAGAQVMGVLLAVVVLGLVRSVGAEHATRRLVRAGWRDLARRAGMKGVPDTAAWISRMLDRIGMLTPRLLALGRDPSTPLRDILSDTRIGIAVDDLRRLRADSGRRDAAIAALILRAVQRHVAARTTRRSAAPDTRLVGAIDLALARLGHGADAGGRRAAVLALTSLRRNLAPAAIAGPA